MIIGILSDTHGKADMALEAVRLLVANGAEYLVHCGDVCGTDVLDALAGHPAMFVFGNNDDNPSKLRNYAGVIGIQCGETRGELTFGSKRAVVTHGDDHKLINTLIREQQIDYLFVGHSHETMDRHVGKIRVINPGALYRAAVKTAAVLDTESGRLQFLPVRIKA